MKYPSRRVTEGLVLGSGMEANSLFAVRMRADLDGWVDYEVGGRMAHSSGIMNYFVIPWELRSVFIEPRVTRLSVSICLLRAMRDDDDEELYNDKSVKYDEDDNKSDEVNRVVDEEINSTVSNRLKD